jgi:acetyl-CoA acyltransferase
MAGLLAGLPVEVPAVTVNRLCASGLDAAVQGARQIRLGEAGVVLAGGVESMSRAPLVTLKPERGFARGNLELVDTTIGWRFVNPCMPEAHTQSLGETAENVAERFSVSREDQDALALESHRRAVAAADAGRLDDEIVAQDVPQPKGEAVTVHSDEGPRRDTSIEELARLRSIFRAARAPHLGTLAWELRRRGARWPGDDVRRGRDWHGGRHREPGGLNHDRPRPKAQPVHEVVAC